MIKKALLILLLALGFQLSAQTFTGINVKLTGGNGSTGTRIDYNQDGKLEALVSGLSSQYGFYAKNYRYNAMQRDTVKELSSSEHGIFIYTAKVKPMAKKICFYVFASCYCDLYGTGKKGYHVFFSPVKKQTREYALQRKFNSIIRKDYPFWTKFNQAEIIENGFVTYSNAQKSKKIAIRAYKSNGFIIHELKW